MKIAKAKLSDSKHLTALTIRSKAHWNYDEKQILEWIPDLTITKKYFEESEIFKLSQNNQLIGFYAYRIENKTDLKLDFLFVEPDCIGKGYGELLLSDLIRRSQVKKINRVLVESDPNSEGFYFNYGFRVIGKFESSIKDRFLPIMELHLKS